MTPDDLHLHSRAWLLTAERLEAKAREQAIEIAGQQVESSALHAVVELARAASAAYAELAWTAMDQARDMDPRLRGFLIGFLAATIIVGLVHLVGLL